MSKKYFTLGCDKSCIRINECKYVIIKEIPFDLIVGWYVPLVCWYNIVNLTEDIKFLPNVYSILNHRNLKCLAFY